VATEAAETAELLARALAERDAGRGASAAGLYDEAAARARAGGDHESWARAALGAASVQVFGAEPGRLPSLLYDVLARTTDDALRSQLAAALARCWVYAGEAGRAAQFSDEAVQLARGTGDPALLADALDAALAVHWGPDELDARRALARELDDVAAHLTEPDARLQAHLWGLQVSCEALDIQAMHRHMRALERVGEESPRARFFAATRRLMLDLLRGRTDTTERLLAIADEAAEISFIPDAWMVVGAMEAYSAVQAGDAARIVPLAQMAEDFALAEGVPAVCAEAAYWWAAAGDLDRARALVDTFHGGVLDGLPHDVNWLLTQQCVLETALVLHDKDLVERGAALLAPYAGRAVVNAGAVMFHGTTDDTLARAYAMQGRHAEALDLRVRALTTYERIGAQWWRDRLAASRPAQAEHDATQDGRRAHLHPSSGGLWLVGGLPTPVAGLRGLGYLRDLVRRPWQPISALDLVGSHGQVVEESGLGEVADRQALAAYRHRLRDLDAEIAEAEEWSDTGRVEAARVERDALLDEIGRAAGLGGRPRTTGSSQERARVAVKKAISTAIGRIADVDEPLAQHLRNSIRTGLNCSYEPEPRAAPEWVLDRSD
jgi:tetratricopeptide (TPR) repeat protein